MSPSEKEDNTKKTDAGPEPLCLFCFPEDATSVKRKTYVSTLPREASVRRPAGKEEKVKGTDRKLQEREKEKEEIWLRKRTEARIRRRRMKEPIRNLRSYLLTSVKNEKVAPKSDLPSLFEVLETVKDAWPSPSSVAVRRREDQNKKQLQDPKPKMKDEQVNLQFPSQLLNRRLSMPEELMRKYSVKGKTSEESETNKTMFDISPSSSSTMETARRRDTEGGEAKVPEPEKAQKADACQQTAEFESGHPQKTDLPKRVTQDDYYKQGKSIIKVKATDKGVCTCQSSTTASAKEETDESGTTESIPSSSPTQLPKRESSSGNVSSESDNMRCTCAELSSKETSTDLYFSGKSTLSQTVSDKSISTQDSTVSINSVSTRGSTASDNSNSTTPEVERTSAKETTTSPDYSPRTPRNRKSRRRDKHSVCKYSKTCPKHSRNYFSVNQGRQCPLHSEKPQEQPKTTATVATNTDRQEISATQTTETTDEVADCSQNIQTETSQPAQSEEKTELPPPEEHYKWAKLSQEELYMMQQLRHRKFVESQTKASNPLPPTPDADSLTTCGSGSAYPQTEQMEQQILIPRYSALPRSLSMLVNTSSPEASHNSDSDSLADSLEDQPTTHVHKLYFDTKRESKPVRGDVSILQDNKQKPRQPRGRAFFVSIKEPYGEDEMLENIDKIPQPPEKIKNQIFERHLNLCAKHKYLHEPDKQKKKTENLQKKRKPKSKNEETDKTKKNPQEESKHQKAKRKEDEKPKTEKQEAAVRKKKESNEAKQRFNSKIPVLVSSRSTSSSPERDSEAKEKPNRPKLRTKREKESEAVENAPKQREVETTQILEITQSGTELSLQKPQAVIHPSFEAKTELTMPPLTSTVRIPPSARQTWNKQFLLAPARRSPIGKFRQRFEVIPEEKSSSLSSAEEKNGRGNLPKFADACTSPLPPDKAQFNSYNLSEVPNLFVAKFTNKQLETLPYVKGNDNQKIILFSSKPQNSNSSKGRDALIAMNRDDFNRLAKGWMSFYKLNENAENSDNEEKANQEKSEKPGNEKQSNPKTSEKGQSDHGSQKENSCLSQSKRRQDEPELGDNIRFDCSNTILRVPHSDSCRSIKKQNSLPELKVSSQKNCEMHKSTSGPLPKVGKKVAGDDDDTDSDSTDYMEPPSPRVPPLPIDGIASDATLSSSEDEFEDPKPTTLKYLHFKKRGSTNRTKLKKENSSEISRFGRKKNSGWSVTVAGTVELSRSAPDLEMRLSFPANGGPPLVSQSDSGFADDSNYSKLSESLQDLDSITSRKELPLGSGNLTQKWTVTVKNPEKGDKTEPNKQFPNNPNRHLPDLESQTRNSKKVFKDVQLEGKVKRLVERKMKAIWPKVQKVIKKEFLTESGRLITEMEDCFGDGRCLSVRGSAVSLERKQKPPTMTERDVTRRYTSRTDEQLL